jgi:hypothetical protein
VPHVGCHLGQYHDDEWKLESFAQCKWLGLTRILLVVAKRKVLITLPFLTFIIFRVERERKLPRNQPKNPRSLPRNPPKSEATRTSLQ